MSVEAARHVALAECRKDRVHDFRRSKKYVAIPEPQRAETLGLEKLVPPGVIWRLIAMLRTIEFDNDTPFDADEVTDERANWMLAPEFEVRHLASS